MHGDEVLGVNILMYLLEYFLEFPDKLTNVLL